jgi:hypothetical protein
MVTVRAQKAGLSKLPQDEQAAIKKTLSEFDFGTIDLGVWGKKMILLGIDWVQAELIPKLSAKNAYLGVLIAGILDAVEGALK